MDLKCLMKLLIEKEYIEVIKTDTEENGDLICGKYKGLYKEVVEKVHEEIDIAHACDYMHEIQIDRQNDFECTFVIMNQNIIKEILLLENEEEFHFDTRKRFGIQINNLEDVFKYDDDIDIHKNYNVTYTVTNNIIKNKRIKTEKDKKNECLDFLSKLP